LLGPFTVGTTFRVGVFVQGSQTLGGFDIYVASNPMFVRPTGGNFGPLIPHPTFLTICVNNVSQTGTCTAGTVNGPGVVEVTAINDDRSGKVCGGVSPCSGMAFLINYTVVASTTSSALFYPTSSSGCANSSVSSPPDVCVLIVDSVGNTLPENIQAATVTTTLTGLVCITFPSTSSSCPASAPMFGPFAVGSNFTVGVFIQGSQAMAGFDIYVAVNYTVLHPVSASLGPLIAHPSLTSICVNGVAVTGSCTVGTANGVGVVEVTTIESSGGTECAGASPCSGLAFTITYNVVGASSGTPIFYPSSSACNPSSVSGTTTCLLVTNSVGATLPENIQGATVSTVSDFSFTAATSSLSIPAGSSASDTLTVTSIGSFTGNVALTNSSVPSEVAVVFVPDPVTITTAGGSATSSMHVFVGALAGTSFTIIVIATTGSITHSLAVSVTVTAAPSFSGGQVHWTHHISLSKTNGTQTWTVVVANPLSTGVNVVVRIVGSSATNPSLTFDVTCGVTCVNTAGGVNSTPGLTPVSVAAGAKSFSFSFNQLVDPSFANTKITFTATLHWTTGTLYASSSSKSGAFAVMA